MPRKRVVARSLLLPRLQEEYPELDDPAEAVRSGRVSVDRRVVLNPNSQVSRSASIRVEPSAQLRGETKLGWALDFWDVPVEGTVTLDVGASAGGFTSALLARGAERVYAVDVGFGQLLGSLRQNPRVVALERTNAADLDRARIPDPLEVVVVDVSYTPLRTIVQQITAQLDFASCACLVGLVKPMFELQRDALPSNEAELEECVLLAARGIEQAGWTVSASERSPQPGAGGATEFFLYARR